MAEETKIAAETKIPRTYEFHPLADLFPLLDKESNGFKALIEDIKANRQQELVWLLDGKILDGRNRYRACQHLGIDVQTREYRGIDPIGFVLSVNLHRRHLNASQRAMVGAKLTELELGANQHTEGTSIEVAAKLLNVGRASIERARLVLKNGDPSAVAEVEQGQTSVTAAAAAATNTAAAGTGTNPGTGKSASDKYDSAEAKLIEKLKDLKPNEADAAATETVKKLRATVATMLKAAASAQAA
jgi:ParB-like chromosome segregation protein Spo0J